MSAAIVRVMLFCCAVWVAADKADLLETLSAMIIRHVPRPKWRDYTISKENGSRFFTIPQPVLTPCTNLCIILCSPESEHAVRRIRRNFLTSMRFQIMYAVIKTGGKQYKVVAGEKLKVEQIPADIGSELTIDQVLAVGEGESIKFGAPLVEGASVLVTVVSQGRHDKVRIFKMRRRKHYQKRQGHRQNYTEIQVVSING
jgi:large subunit ribosomal protein L21